MNASQINRIPAVRLRSHPVSATSALEVCMQGKRTMLERLTRSPEDRVTAIVAEVLAKRGVTGAVAPDADLGRLGMTSVDMVELMLGVEAEFDLTIPAEEITMASFGSADGIAKLLRRLNAAG